MDAKSSLLLWEEMLSAVGDADELRPSGGNGSGD